MPSSASKKKKTLFDDDVDNDNEPESSSALKIDKKYATAFESRKQKEELRQRALDGDDDDDDGSSSSDEDDHAELLTEELDVNIFKTINALRNKDEKIYDSSVRFFDNTSVDVDDDDEDSDKPTKKTKPKRYKDVIREQVLDQMEREEAEADDDDDEDDDGHEKPSRLAYDMEQQEIRKAFLQATIENDGDDCESGSDDDEGNLLTVKRRNKPSAGEGLSKEFEQELEKLRATADSKDLIDPRGEVQDGELFLLDYFKKKTWKQDDESDGDDESEDDDASDQKLPMKHGKLVGGGNDDDDDSLDDVDKADDFEAQYNFRFEQAAAASASGAEQSLVSYARDITGTLRRKDESRKEKRMARQERKAAERKAKEEELKRLKNLKKQEMHEKLKQVKTVLGEAEGRGEAIDEAAILKLIEGDFDPDKYEELMKEAYNDEFYDKEDSEWKSELDIRNTLKSDEDGEVLVGQDDEHGGLYDDEGYADQGEGEYAEEDYGEDGEYGDEGGDWDEEEAAAESETPLERQVREKLSDELYKLDYEDIIAGQPTRFKYRKVEANSYGLSTEEILFARDTTLRQFVSLKQMAPYNEREFHVNSKKRRRFRDLLKEELETSAAAEAGEADANEETEAEVESQPKKKSRRSKKGSKSKSAEESHEKVSEKADQEPAVEAADTDEVFAPKSSSEKSKEKKKKRKKKHKNKEPSVPGLSTSRLAAYGL